MAADGGAALRRRERRGRAALRRGLGASGRMAGRLQRPAVRRAPAGPPPGP